MKSRNLRKSLVVVGSMMLLGHSTMNVAAQNSPASIVPQTAATNQITPDTASTNQAAPVRLSHGVADVLKLSQAKIADDTIVTYIENSGRIYHLSTSEIIYLREQGVSYRALTAMLTSRTKVIEDLRNLQETRIATSAAQMYYSEADNNPETPYYAAPSPTYVEPEPSSTTSDYEIPPQPYYSYYNYYPYYGGYWGYPYPGLSVSLGLGNFTFGYGDFPYGGYYYGGYYGGGHHHHSGGGHGGGGGGHGGGGSGHGGGGGGGGGHGGGGSGGGKPH